MRAYTNSRLEVLRVVATIFDRRTRLAREVIKDLPDRYGIPLLPPRSPKRSGWQRPLIVVSPSCSTLTVPPLRRPTGPSPTIWERHENRRSQGEAGALRAAPGTVVVECSSCGEHRRIQLGDAIACVLRISAWLPFLRHNRWTLCPPASDAPGAGWPGPIDTELKRFRTSFELGSPRRYDGPMKASRRGREDSRATRSDPEVVIDADSGDVSVTLDRTHSLLGVIRDAHRAPPPPPVEDDPRQDVFERELRMTRREGRGSRDRGLARPASGGDGGVG